MDVLLREAEHRFPGGLALPAMKDLSTAQSIAVPHLPSQLIIPLKQHSGSDAIPCVKPGDYVYKGQLIAAKHGQLSANIHASTSGYVSSIGLYPIAHASAQAANCIRIIPDGEDNWINTLQGTKEWRTLSSKEIIHTINAAGIVGLGGATFPTDTKLTALKNSLDILIINAAECEPYISCDDMLMREYSEDIIQGIQILMHATQPQRCMLAIEDNKPQAIEAMRAAISDSSEYLIELYTLPSIYPQGGEKQLVQSLTGLEIPSGKHANDINMLMFNVATVQAIQKSIVEGQPLLSRIVTVTGSNINNPRNLEALIGTPINELIEFCGGYNNTTQEQALIMGGPLMGISLYSDSVPVVKAMNCLLAATASDKVAPKEAKACIRCGECATACPASLLPQQLYWYSKAENYKETERFHLFDCIECGACDYVCPSHIPLVNYFRHAKGEIRQQRIVKQHADTARTRYERRTERLERIATERKEKLAAKKSTTRTLTSSASATDSSTTKNTRAIAEIMQRAKQKKSQSSQQTINPNEKGVKE